MEKNDKICEEILSECKNWKERILVKLFPDMYIRVYHAARIDGINSILKK